jgi:uncharacterized protein YciI
VQFLVRSRAATAAPAVEDQDALNQAHWSYMDRFAEGMTARGPLLSPDREQWRGSVHVVDLPSVDAARAFVAEEPYQRAGRFGSHDVWRFTDLLGRTMWEFAGPADEPRFLVVAPRGLGELPEETRDRVIVHGELRDPDDDRPAGVVLAIQAPSRQQLDGWLALALPEGHPVEVDDWEFGGRR